MGSNIPHASDAQDLMKKLLLLGHLPLNLTVLNEPINPVEKPCDVYMCVLIQCLPIYHHVSCLQESGPGVKLI
jgi:hypothetical protein